MRTMDEDLNYHRQRANRELNLGLACGSIRVARAHLQLSSLHFKKMRDLELRTQAARGVEPPPFVL